MGFILRGMRARCGPKGENAQRAQIANLFYSTKPSKNPAGLAVKLNYPNGEKHATMEENNQEFRRAFL
jgi:hypothetical protein